MSDFLSRVEAILSGVMNFNPKSRVERLLMKWVGSVGNLEDLETEDKSSIVAAINEVAASGGSGKPYHVGTNPPSNTNLFWINTQDEIEISLADGVLSFGGVDTITDIDLVGTELRMR